MLSKVTVWHTRSDRQTDRQTALKLYTTPIRARGQKMRSSPGFEARLYTPTHAVCVHDEWWLLKTEMRTQCRYYRIAIKSNTSWHLASCRLSLVISARHRDVDRRPTLRLRGILFQGETFAVGINSSAHAAVNVGHFPWTLFPFPGHFAPCCDHWIIITIIIILVANQYS